MQDIMKTHRKSNVSLQLIMETISLFLHPTNIEGDAHASTEDKVICVTNKHVFLNEIMKSAALVALPPHRVFWALLAVAHKGNLSLSLAMTHGHQPCPSVAPGSNVHWTRLLTSLAGDQSDVMAELE